MKAELRTERIVFIGKASENTLALINSAKHEDYQLKIHYVENDVTKLILTCINEEPGLIMLDMCMPESIYTYICVMRGISKKTRTLIGVRQDATGVSHAAECNCNS